jgi:nucleotide-binding universal stress UspA family protein
VGIRWYANDGSEESRAALRWAAEEAELRGADVEAVLAWMSPRLLGAIAPHADRPMPVVVGDPGVDARDAEQALVEVLGEVFGDRLPPRLTPLVVEGHPAGVLLAQALHADLLVVGSRGRSGRAWSCRQPNQPRPQQPGRPCAPCA